MCESVNIHELSRSFHGVFTASHFLGFLKYFSKQSWGCHFGILFGRIGSCFAKHILGMSYWDFVWKNLQINILGMSSWDFVWKNWILFCKNLEELDPVLQKNLGDVILGVCLEEADPVLRKKHLGGIIVGFCLEEVDPVLRKNHLGVSSWDFVWKNPPCFTKTFW